VDYLLPELTPIQASMYLFFLTESFVKKGTTEVRIGKRTLATKIGKGARGENTNYKHVSDHLKCLEEIGCLRIGDTNIEGTLYQVVLPENVPVVIERMKAAEPLPEEEDFFTDPAKRLIVFERDNWICAYCGEKVGFENATLDHLLPQFKGGKHTKENLKTSCLMCNSIKSGKTFEEAAPFLLKSIQERNAKKQP
jgi:hypothetical protein